MPALSFSCPYCAAPLKVRDESFVGQTVPCPECERVLQIGRNDDGHVIGQEWTGTENAAAPAAPAKDEAPPSTARRRKAAAANAAGTSPKSAAPAERGTLAAELHERTSLGAPHQTPKMVAWSVAGICLAGFCFFMIPWSGGTGSEEAPAAEEPASNVPPAVAADRPDDPAPANATAPPKGPPTVESRLRDLGTQLLARAKRDGHFLPGTVAGDLPPSNRFSWQAVLAAEMAPNGPAPLWERGWRDPLNDRFVRRRLVEFQNPRVRDLTGADSYPATHFVGVAGVGADAAELPASDSRAGIFGTDRKTRLEDVRDGLANTMLVAGVDRELGSWASGGAATVRSFNHEPYINGPDGFGTGDPNQMFVLMADGSVRSISKDTDPRIVRRMAAMADGLPLDPQVPGEPGDRPNATPPADDPQLAAKPDPEAAAPPAEGNPPAPKAEVTAPKPATPPEPEMPAVDIPAALAQKILLIDQPKPVPVSELLFQVEEMLGVPIVIDRERLGDSAAKLDKSISLKLHRVTVGEILKAVLERGELDYRIEENRIEVIPIASGAK